MYHENNFEGMSNYNNHQVLILGVLGVVFTLLFFSKPVFPLFSLNSIRPQFDYQAQYTAVLRINWIRFC